jgi:hypothetical protein
LTRVAYVLATIAITLAGVPSGAFAKDMDITTHRLFAGGASEAVANARFGSLMAQLGGAVEPLTLTPANTLGMSGFYFGFETGVSNIDNGQDYWQLGTEGGRQANDTDGNPFVQGALTYSRAMFRKGFPFGVDIGIGAGHVYNSSLFLWSGDIKIGLFEGWVRKWPAFMPDFTLHGFVTAVTGDSAFTMTVPGGGLIVSKPIVLGQTMIFTPMIHARVSWTVADSAIVPALDVPQDGGGRMDARYVYDNIRVHRIRLAPGFELKYQRFQLAAAFLFDVAGGPEWENDAGQTLSVASQWRIDIGVGVNY